MSVSTHSRPASRGVFWRSGLCLLLAVLFLYSPFFTIYGSSHSLKVQQLPSYRGTVASSELRRFTVAPLQLLLGSTDRAIVVRILCPAMVSSFGPPPEFAQVPFQQQALLSNFWFRPPPVL
jgi:hypothetical protein